LCQLQDEIDEARAVLDAEFEFVRIMRQNVLPRAASVYAHHYFIQHVRVITVTFSHIYHLVKY